MQNENFYFETEATELQKREALKTTAEVWREIVGCDAGDLESGDRDQIVSALYDSLQPAIDQTIDQLGIQLPEGWENPGKSTEEELEICKAALVQLKGLDYMKCGSFPKIIQETGKVNCTGQTMLMQRLMERASISYIYANPARHVAGIVQTSDGNYWYADPGNISDDLSDLTYNLIQLKQPKQIEIAGNKVLEIEDERIDSHLVRLCDKTEIVAGILMNLESLHPDDGINLDEDSQALYHRYQDLLNALHNYNVAPALFPRTFEYYYSPEYIEENQRIKALHNE